MDGADHKSLYALFASLLDYPTAALLTQIGACLGMLAQNQAEAAELLGQYKQSIETLDQEQIEELYTNTFDLQPVVYPYVGYQLFGESYKRGAFMARLNAEYQSHGYSSGNELPDHAAVVLRFLARDGVDLGDEFSRTLLCEGLQPAIKKITQAFDGSTGNPYVALFGALDRMLTDEWPTSGQPTCGLEKERLNG